MTEFKSISPESIPHALEKVERYRLLNEPAEAESICRDVLRVEPENQRALIGLLLTLTDQFAERPAINDAREILARLEGEYERAYYEGIILERQGKALLRTGPGGTANLATGWLQEAMRAYGRAEALRPAGNDDPILRWNACARILRDHHLGPRPEDDIEPLLE